MKVPEDTISYSVICENSPTPNIYSDTYLDAVQMAMFEQPAYRPYYIVKRVEHFEICAVVGDKVETVNIKK